MICDAWYRRQPTSRQFLNGSLKSDVTYLVAGEDQSIGNHNILPSAGSKDNDLGDVISGQRLDTPAAR